MNLNIDWSKDFQEFQEILNSGIQPEWLYCAKANLVLEPAYTGEANNFSALKILLTRVKLFHSFNKLYA